MVDEDGTDAEGVLYEAATRTVFSETGTRGSQVSSVFSAIFLKHSESSITDARQTPNASEARIATSMRRSSRRRKPGSPPGVDIAIRSGRETP